MSSLAITVGLMMLASLIGAVGSVYLKRGAPSFRLRLSVEGIVSQLGNLNLLAGIFLYVCSTVFFLYLLRTNDLSLLYPLTSFGYIFVAFLSVYWLKERMNSYRLLGVLSIVLGIVLVTIK